MSRIRQALNHANKALRLSSLKEFDLYKAIANEKNYRGGDYYNADVLEKSQRKRIYLWIWQKILSKEMAIEDELQFTKPEFDINNVEETRNQIKKYLDYADVITGLQSLGKGTYENLTKAGTRTFSYELTKLSSLTVGGCSTVVKLYDANNQDSIELSDSDMCKNLMKVLNPVGDPASKLAVTNPILSSFLPEVLPKLLHAKRMNWLHFNTKSLRTISKLKVSKPDVISIALSIASISNDFYGASWASDINEELTTRMVAREWLNIWFRSGFDQSYMNKLINNNSKKLSGTKEQIEAIALKLGSTGALCDTYEFFNPFYECTGIENINYNYDKVVDIINEKLSKSNALYRNVTSLTGSVSDEKGEIGVVEIDWIKDGNLSDYNDTIDDTINSNFHYRDDFNDLNKSFWYIVRMYGPNGPYWKNNVTDYNSVNINNGIIELNMDRTDDGPIMYSKPIPVKKGDVITITRKVYVHPENRYFTGSMSIVSSDNTFSIDHNETLATVMHYDYSYQGDWNTFILNDRDTDSNFLEPIWNNWFTEILKYNTLTGESTYSINNKTVRSVLKPLNKNYVKIRIHSFGWWTGHYTKMDYIDINVSKIE